MKEIGNYIEIPPQYTVDNVPVPKDKWVGVILAQGIDDDITVVYDRNICKDHVYEVFCSIKCPLCGSRKIIVTIEGELAAIRCKECGKTVLKLLKPRSNYIAESEDDIET